MSIHTYGLSPQRIGKFKGAIIAHAVPQEKLTKQGRMLTRTLPKNNGDTYVMRRFLPYGASSTNFNTMNRFFADGTGDRAATMVQAHQIQEGANPEIDNITPMDLTVVIQEYGCLYGFTNKTVMLFEDDIPAEAKKQVGERTVLVNEMIMYGILKACTNQYYGGTGTSLSTVNGAISLNMLRKITMNLRLNHAKLVTSVLSPSGDYGTDAVAAGWFVFINPECAPDIEDLPNYTPAEKYASGKPMPDELGKCAEFRFILHPDLPARQDAGAAVGSTGLYSTSGSNIDVHQFVIIGAEAYSQLVLRGENSIDVTFLPVGQKTKSDPFGLRGYYGAHWWKAGTVENDGWMAVGNVGRKALS
jgi:N4-gp56 family major capsid protein